MAFCLTLVLLLTGCAVMQLNTFNNHAANGDHGWIAAQAVTCTSTTTVCSRLHLIKGSACFHLATSGIASVDNYTCAADELEQGLALNPSLPDAVDLHIFQERLCESLTNLQDPGAAEAGTRHMDRLVDAAEGLYRLSPESVAAVYYLAKARLVQMQPVIITISPAGRVPVCNRLKRTVTRVLSMMESADDAFMPDWDRFADRYQLLAFELGQAMRTAQCR